MRSRSSMIAAALVVALLPLQLTTVVARRRTPTVADPYRAPIVLSLSGAAVAGDVDGDEHPDIVGLYRDRGLAVLHGPAFGAPTQTFAGLDAATLADVDGDGVLDVVAVDETSRPHRVVTLRYAGRTAPTVVASTFDGWGVNSIVGAADLTGDGNVDLVVVASPAADDRTALVVAAGLGDGRFGSPQLVPGLGTSRSAPTFVHLADMDGDGHADLLAIGSDHHLELLRSLGGARFAPPQTVTGRTDLDELAVGDLNGDGTPDVVATNEGATELVVVWNRRGTLVEGPVVRTGIRSSESFGDFVGVGDLNGDGRPDVVLKSSAVAEGRQPPGFNSLRVYLNDGHEGFSAGHGLRDPAGRSEPILLADLNGDRTTDLITARGLLLSRR